MFAQQALCPWGCGVCASATAMEGHITECLMEPRKLLAAIRKLHDENQLLRTENVRLQLLQEHYQQVHAEINSAVQVVQLRAENIERLHAEDTQSRQAQPCRQFRASTTKTTGTHLLALPGEVVVLILASLAEVGLRAVRIDETGVVTSPDPPPPRWMRAACTDETSRCELLGLTTGHVLARAGACCKAFAIRVREAATVIAGRHGWRLPVIGSAPMHLSKLEQDTTRVRYYLQLFPFWTSSQIQFVDVWTEEVSPGFIGALFIDPQVRQQHTLELGKLLIKIGIGAGSNGPRRLWDIKIAKVFHQLVQLMAQPGTPLTASWLVAVLTLDVWNVSLKAVRCQSLPMTQRKLTELLGYIEPHVLRSHPETFGWLPNLY